MTENLIIYCIVVILLLALALFGVRRVPLGSPWSGIVQGLLVLLAIVLIANKAGIF